MSDNREDGDRQVCEIESKIVLLSGDVEIGCMIRNLSEKGARLEMNHEIPLPQTFSLVVPTESIGFDVRLVEVRWQAGKNYGVRFAEERPSVA